MAEASLYTRAELGQAQPQLGFWFAVGAGVAVGVAVADAVAVGVPAAVGVPVCVSVVVAAGVVFGLQQSLMTKADSTAAVLHFEMACRHSDLNDIANVFSPFKLQSCTLSTSNMLISSRQAQPSTGESEEHSFNFAANLSATS